MTIKDKVLRGLGEYFFATESKKYHNGVRRIRREFTTDYDERHTETRRHLRSIGSNQRMEFMAGKLIPNVWTAWGVGMATWYKEPMFLQYALFGEALRAGMWGITKYMRKKETETLQRTVDRTTRESETETIEDLFSEE